MLTPAQEIKARMDADFAAIDILNGQIDSRIKDRDDLVAKVNADWMKFANTEPIIGDVVHKDGTMDTIVGIVRRGSMPVSYILEWHGLVDCGEWVIHPRLSKGRPIARPIFKFVVP